MKKTIYFVLILTSIISINACAQKITTKDQVDKGVWNNKKYAVVLSYDDGLDVHLDNVIPILDSVDFKATFYVHGNSRSLYNRPSEWAALTQHGHELGSHSIFHPCLGKSLGREWVNPDYDLDTYTITRMDDELKLSKTLFDAIDGKKARTYAYPCSDTLAGKDSFIHLVKSEFTAGRLVGSQLNNIDDLDIYKIYSFSSTGRDGQGLIDIAKQAEKENALVVFLFHGVGGGHPLNISIPEHNKLINYLNQNKSKHWLSTMKEVTDYIIKYRSKG